MRDRNEGEILVGQVLLYFHLKSKKLTMFSVQKKRKFVMVIATTVPSYYIHFNFLTVHTKLTLEQLRENECGRLLENKKICDYI